MKAQVCPVCQGRGFVDAGFYDDPSKRWSWVPNSAPKTEKCRTCKGEGIVRVREEPIWPKSLDKLRKL